MDEIKRALANEVQETIRYKIDTTGLTSVEELLDEVVPITYKRLSDLVGEIRVGQGPGRDPRYFEIIVKERR